MVRYSRHHEMEEAYEGPESARGFHFGAGVGEAGRELLIRTYAVMVLGLLITGLVSMTLMQNPVWFRYTMQPSIFFGLIIAQFVFVFAIAGWVTRMSAPVAWILFLVYACLSGITLTPILFAYTQASVAKVFFITSGTFAASSVFGFVTKRDLTSVGHFATMGLIGIIIASLVSFLIPGGGSPMMTFVISVAGVIIFTLLTAYDTQMIVRMGEMGQGSQQVAILGALSLYLDFINLFIFLLRLFGSRE